MNRDIDDDVGGPMVVETADGSFYQHYKTGVLEFLKFVAQTGGDAIASGRLLEKDQVEVERGLANLTGPTRDLFPFLSKKIDERDPSFFDECVVASIWDALGAVFLIAQHSGFTDSAKVHARTLQSSGAGKQSGTKRAHDADKAWRRDCLMDAIVIRNARPATTTSALGTELWEKMPRKPGKPADPRTVSAYLSQMEREGRLPKKIGRTGSA